MVPGLPMSFEANEPRIRVPHIWKPPGDPILEKSECIGYLATILIRHKRTPDSSSPCLKTPWELHCGEIWVYRLPSNHCHPRKTDPGFELPTSNYPWMYQNPSHLVSFSKMFFWPGDRQTNTQTHKHTNFFFFVRPSFQSRELFQA